MSHYIRAGRGRTAAAAAVLALFAWVLIGTAFAPAASAEDDFRYLIRMDHRSFIPTAGDYASGLDFLARHASDGMVHMLVQMQEVPAAPVRADLSSRGLILQGYLPERAYYALVSAELEAGDLASLGVRWLAPIDPADKISPRVHNGEFGPWTEYSSGWRILAVQFHDDVTQSAAEQILGGAILAKGGWIQSTRTQILATDPRDIPVLATLDGVKYIAQLPPTLSEVNDGIRQSIGVNTLQAAPYGLSGQGSNVLVYDVGMVDRNHPDFATNRVTYGEGGSPASHSTHCGGTVAGNGAASGGTYKGMAPQAKITSYKYESCTPYCLYNSPQDIEANYRDGFFIYGANLSSNSLGSNIAPNGYPCSWEGDYELTAQLLDAISHGSLGLPFLSVWAAGNERAYGTCGTSYNTTGIPATAKDNIVVGATNSNDHSMTYFSSWGPVDDGRIRPDICAPGCQVGGDGGITSTTPGGGYGTMCGTSMATPATAGVIALLLEQWRQSFGLPLSPAPASMKALLINTAFDYGNAGPDFQFGYGEIRPVDAADHLRSRFLTKEGSIDTGEEAIFRIDVPSGQPVLKATVAWDDPEGQLLAQKELINDLDLTLESPTGGITLPWVLNPASPSNPATRGVDRTNPVEQVLVSAPAAGIWKIHVRGYQIPDGPQTFTIMANAPVAPSVGAEPVLSAVQPGIGDLASYPNPFTPRTTIRFRTDGGAPVSLSIFDSGGRKVRSLLSQERREAGTHFVTWDGMNDEGQELPSGIYFYQVAMGEKSAGRKVLMVR